MRELLVVGLGGFIGSVLRFKVGGYILRFSESWRFPLSTFLVNLTGCFVIGILAGLAERHHLFGAQLRLFLFTGLLGGYTTFSAFGFETVYLIRTGSWQIGLLNVVLGVLCGLAAVIIGHALSTAW